MEEFGYEVDDPYAYEWTLDAFDSIQAGTLHREIIRDNSRVPILARIWGICPRCEHDLRYELPLSSVTYDGVLGGDLVLPPKTRAVDVLCGCDHRHGGAPEGVAGCGIGFRVEVKDGRDG